MIVASVPLPQNLEICDWWSSRWNRKLYSSAKGIETFAAKKGHP